MNIQVFFNSILVGGGATLIATQILKSNYIPISFEKYPRETTALVSLIAAIIAEAQSGVSVNFHDLPTLLGLFVGTLWVAISTYNHLQLSNNKGVNTMVDSTNANEDQNVVNPAPGETPEGSTVGPQPTDIATDNVVQPGDEQVVDTGPKAGANSEGQPPAPEESGVQTSSDLQ